MAHTLLTDTLESPLNKHPATLTPPHAPTHTGTLPRTDWSMSAFSSGMTTLGRSRPSSCAFSVAPFTCAAAGQWRQSNVSRAAAFEARQVWAPQTAARLGPAPAHNRGALQHHVAIPATLPGCYVPPLHKPLLMLPPAVHAPTTHRGSPLLHSPTSSPAAPFKRSATHQRVAQQELGAGRGDHHVHGAHTRHRGGLKVAVRLVVNAHPRGRLGQHKAVLALGPGRAHQRTWCMGGRAGAGGAWTSAHAARARWGRRAAGKLCTQAVGSAVSGHPLCGRPCVYCVARVLVPPLAHVQLHTGPAEPAGIACQTAGEQRPGRRPHLQSPARAACRRTRSPPARGLPQSPKCSQTQGRPERVGRARRAGSAGGSCPLLRPAGSADARCHQAAWCTSQCSAWPRSSTHLCSRRGADHRQRLGQALQRGPVRVVVEALQQLTMACMSTSTTSGTAPGQHALAQTRLLLIGGTEEG